MRGAVYVLARALVNVAALSLHRESAFGVFHALAVVSLVTIGVGLGPLLLGRRSAAVIATHAYCMAWSYAGLVVAGCGQLAVAVGQGDRAGAVPVVIGTVLSISGVIIFGEGAVDPRSPARVNVVAVTLAGMQPPSLNPGRGPSWRQAEAAARSG